MDSDYDPRSFFFEVTNLEKSTWGIYRRCGGLRTRGREWERGQSKERERKSLKQRLYIHPLPSSSFPNISLSLPHYPLSSYVWCCALPVSLGLGPQPHRPKVPLTPHPYWYHQSFESILYKMSLSYLRS